MEAEAFAVVPVRVVYIPDDTETIGAGAFARCPNLAQVRVPLSVTAIAADAFAGCPAGLVIFGTPGSYAEDFAEANGYLFTQE